MGITIAIHNDVKFPVYAQFRMIGGIRIGSGRYLGPGETWKKTDKGLSASYNYRVVVFDPSAVDGLDQCEWMMYVRAPSTPGVKTVLVSEIMSKGEKKIKQTRISKTTFIKSLWHQLDSDNTGELSINEIADWVNNEQFVRNKAFYHKSAQSIVRQMIREMDNDKSKSISRDEFIKFFAKLKRNVVTNIGYTIWQYPRAKMEAAILPFRSLDTKRRNVISTKHLARWFSKKTREKRTLKILEDLKDKLDEIKDKEDITFWEWVNLVSPVKDTDGNAVTRTRLLCSEVLGLSLAPSTMSTMAPRMNIVIMICGSRGDVQPFIPIGQLLKKIGHRVRIATHANFRDFVTKNGLEFYPIGGDPKELMAYMVKTKGQLMPGIFQLMSSEYWRDTKERLKMMEDIIKSGWNGANSTDVEGDNVPFVADVIISNPTTYSHVHLAEAMGVPLHMFFTMPWTPTSTFPHPMGNAAYTELKGKDTKTKELVDTFADYKKNMGKKAKSGWRNNNVYTYKKVEMVMHVGMGNILSRFRKEFGLSAKWDGGAGILNAREVPFAYLWSPSLIPKPLDWGSHIDVVGFSELKGSGFTQPPPEDIDMWIKKEPERPPIFIGFGSCVLPNVKRVSECIYKAAKIAGIRVILQEGWAGLGKHLKDKEGVSFVKGAKYEDDTEAGDLDLTRKDFCLVIGRVAHSWLFDMVAGVVHHGGAGTTYAGLKAARPTMVAPFFGDQPFWGQMVNNAGAGPSPLPVEQWQPESLAESFKSMYSKEQKKAAVTMSKAFRRENGAKEAVRVFHEKLHPGQLECDLLPTDVAKYYVPNWRLKLGLRAVEIMLHHRPKWYKKLMGPLHKYMSFDWSHGGMPGYIKDEIKDLDEDLKIKVSEKEIEIVDRNLRAIMDARGKDMAAEVKVIHPDPRLRT